MSRRLTVKELDKICNDAMLSTDELNDLHLPVLCYNHLYSIISELSTEKEQTQEQAQEQQTQEEQAQAQHNIIIPVIPNAEKQKLISKLVYLFNALINMNDDSYMYPLSEGMLRNVFMTMLKHVYSISIDKQITPFIEVNPIMSSIMFKLFLLIVSNHQDNEVKLHEYFYRFMIIVIQCATGKFVCRFNVDYPVPGIHRNELTSSVQAYAKRFNIPCPHE